MPGDSDQGMMQAIGIVEEGGDLTANVTADGIYPWACQENNPIGEPFPRPVVVPPIDPENDFNCEQFYGGTTTCAIRKAWLCDYARWRWSILTVWLDQFYQQSPSADLHTHMPTCTAGSSDITCRNDGQLRCSHNQHTNCNECYCADHEYLNLPALMTQWRNDHRAWMRYYHEYQSATPSYGGC